MSDRTVVVLNHFAVPLGQPGGTRHVELFSKLPGWRSLIIAARLNLVTGLPQAPEDGFVPVPVSSYSRNGVRRVANWLSYFVTATWVALRGPRPDLVYASSPHLLAGLAGRIVAAVRRTPLILEIRDLWPQVLVDMGHMHASSPMYRMLRRLEEYLYSKADAIVVLAPGTQRELTRRGVSADKIHYIPNAADPADFVPSASRDELRERYGFSKITAIYAGAHGPANGLDLLLDAARELDDTGVEIVFVGAGTEKDRLRTRAHELGLVGRVRFMDPVPKSQIPDLLAAADMGIHCLADVPLFRYGVSPNKIYDYMAAALPIITNTPGDLAAMVTACAAGIAVEPTGLAAGIRELAQRTPEGRKALGENGRSWLSAGHSRSAVARSLHSLLAVESNAPGVNPSTMTAAGLQGPVRPRSAPQMSTRPNDRTIDFPAPLHEPQKHE